jgi:hypothetical protein
VCRRLGGLSSLPPAPLVDHLHPIALPNRSTDRSSKPEHREESAQPGTVVRAGSGS